jgi:CBS domain-containing protein
MPEENTFFLHVKDHCHRGLITCHIEDKILDAAKIMRDRSISSIIACDDKGEPVGIMTDRDLRIKVIAEGVDPVESVVREVMTAPVISVNENDTLFEVLYQMSRHRIHRLGVVDNNSKLIGLINESDIIRLQNRSPQQLLRSIDEANSVAELKTIHDNMDELIIFLRGNGVSTRDLVRLISLLNDQINLRLIHILQEEQYPDLPEHCAYLVLGSEGRREQTLKTDQDNAMIYADELSPEQVDKLAAFSQALIDALIEIGVPECPGGIMAKNQFWRRSISDWKATVDGWIATPSGENILNFSMFSDMRTLWGDASLEKQLQQHVIQRASENGIFLAHMAANVCRFPPPLGLFGRIKTEKAGPHIGKMDLKKGGIFAITEGVKTLALEIGELEGSTTDKLHALQQKEVLNEKQVGDLEAAFNLLTFFRLRSQIASKVAGHDPDNHIAPSSLNRVERGRLKVALQVVESFQGSLSSHFQLSMLRR